MKKITDMRINCLDDFAVSMVICVLMSLSSCASDEGNYSYKELNTLSITGVEQSYEIEQFSTLEINPIISGSLSFESENYDYVWFLHLVNDLTNSAPDTLSKMKNLKAEIGNSPSGNYELVFQVKDRSTGLFTQTTSNLTIVNSFSKGLAILSSNDGMSDVTFINSLNKVIDNVYSAVNGRSLGKNPIGIFHAGRNANCHQQLIISTEDSCVVVNGTDFSYEMNLNDMFYFPSKPGILEAFCHGTYGRYEHCIVDGKVFKRNSYIWEGEPTVPMFATYLPCDNAGRVAPVSFYNDNIAAIFYDKINKRFVYDNYYGLSPLAKGFENEYFNPTNLNMDLIWGDNLLSEDGLSYIRMVMKDDGGKVYVLYGMKQTKYDYDTSSRWYYIVPSGKLQLTSDAMQATCYAMSSVDVNFLYYATGNTIVGISILTGNIISKMTLEGGNIDRMEFDPNDPSRMYVGVSDGSCKPKSGTVYYLNMATNGQLSIEKKFDGICGKVVDFQINYGKNN